MCVSGGFNLPTKSGALRSRELAKIGKLPKKDDLKHCAPLAILYGAVA